ncbi:MAG: TetR/AcrR family transcriptional regulator [Candidatus Vecturithrix sp.]|nr:TetR/AcrR family transcriptional regulator [Candidatus Vecturithrix sp.]
MEKEYSLSLRERKHAQTKIALAEAITERLKTYRLKDISVKEVCDTIPISEVTFYNYFPKKTDVLVYILQLWRLEMQWHLLGWEEEKSNLEVIEAYFDFAAQGVEEYPGVMAEALAYFTQKRGCLHFDDLSIAEKILAFPTLPGIEEIQLPPHPKEEKMLEKYIRRAIESGELPSQTDVDFVIHALDALFIGSMMTFYKDKPILLRQLYQQMLKILWKGLWQDAKDEVAASMSGNLQLALN